jgi:hypothetical protein
MSAKLVGGALEADMPSHVAKLILIKLTDAAEHDGTRIFPSVASMARVAKCSERHAHRIVGLFRRSGLLMLVRQSSGRPGEANEYRLDMALFGRLVREGWAATFGADGEGQTGDSMESGVGGGTGDTMSPVETGDIGGGTGDISGGTGDSMESYDPSYNPSTTPVERDAREARAGESSVLSPSKLADAYLLAKLRAAATTTPADSAADTDAAWSALADRAERKQAVDRYPDWVAACKALGRGKLAGLPTYLAERRWTTLAAPTTAQDAATQWVEAFSRSWWWLYHRAVKASRGAFRDRGSAASQELGKRIDLANRRIGWKLPDGTDRRPLDERAAAEIRQVPVDGREAAEWRAAYEALGARWPMPAVAQWIGVPAVAPAEWLAGDRPADNAEAAE